MSDKIVRKVALAALNGAEVDAPEATPQEISLAIMDAHERGLVEASEATAKFRLRVVCTGFRSLRCTHSAARSTMNHFHQKFCLPHSLLCCPVNSAEKESLHHGDPRHLE